MAFCIPKIKAMDMDNIKLPELLQLRNGTPLYMINEGEMDVIRFDILFSGGYTVQRQPLQALFTNRMLREGSVGLSSSGVSEVLDSCGAWVEIYSSQNCNHITLYTVKRHFGKLLKTVEEIVKNPAFRSDDLNVVRAANKSHFQVNSHKVDVLAHRHFEKALWGAEHKFGRMLLAEDYDAITVDVLREYYMRVYGSSNCTLFLSGKLDDADISDVSSAFGNEKWGASEKIEIVDTPPSGIVTGRVKVEVDDSLQSAVKVGTMTLPASHPDFYSMKYMTVLLGGFFGSRLMTNIRERHGYTYHIEADLMAHGHRNSFVVSSETANEYVEPLIEETYKEIKRLREELTSKEEMHKLRNCTLGELCREYESVMTKADVFINTWLSGEPFSGVNSYLDVVRTAKAEDFMRLSNEYLHPEKMVEVVVGA